jgi:hypothetical protein
LIDCKKRASLITSSVISSIPPSRGIVGSGLSFSCGVGNAVARNRASFCSRVIAISSFGPLTVGVVGLALGDVYRRAVQHLFGSSMQSSSSPVGPCRNFCQHSRLAFRTIT